MFCYQIIKFTLTERTRIRKLNFVRNKDYLFSWTVSFSSTMALNLNKSRVTTGKNKFRKLQKSYVDYLRGDAAEPPQEAAPAPSRNRTTAER